MPVPLFLKLSAAIIFGIQFLIFAYLYSSHRVPFFRYLVWAWGFFVVSKVSALSAALIPDAGGSVLALVADFDGVLADLAVVAAALAFGWGYRVRWRHALAGGVYAGLLTLLTHLPATAGALEGPIRMLGGLTFIAAGAAFWLACSRAASCRATRFLAGSLALWGGYRVAFPFLEAQPGTDAYVAGHMLFMLFYFLSVFAIIIMVLDRARREMAALVEFNETLVDGLGEGVQLVDDAYTIQHANRWLVDQFGPVAGRRCYEVLTADGRECRGCPMGERERIAAPVRLDVSGPGGRRFLLTCSPLRRPDGRVSILELVADVTEQERLRARLTEAERLAAVGELATSVAHEIRNPLAAIVNAASLLGQGETLTTAERTGTLDAVKKETRRLNGILSDFLAFARPREVKRLKGDIRQVVDHVAALVRENPACTEGARTIVRVDPAVPLFAFDADQLTQVLWNVAINGMQAMDGCGELRIDVARDNGDVVIAVSDTGRGIPPEDRRRVFEPFYSKKRGGTGLGLSIARRIVAAHGGRIEVESTMGVGTRFMIHLPVDGD
jgi:two-component system sensor histidine kinase PilS (NtrC family)